MENRGSNLGQGSSSQGRDGGEFSEGTRPSYGQRAGLLGAHPSQERVQQEQHPSQEIGQYSSQEMGRYPPQETRQWVGEKDIGRYSSQETGRWAGEKEMGRYSSQEMGQHFSQDKRNQDAAFAVRNNQDGSFRRGVGGDMDGSKKVVKNFRPRIKEEGLPPNYNV